MISCAPEFGEHFLIHIRGGSLSGSPRQASGDNHKQEQTKWCSHRRTASTWRPGVGGGFVRVDESRAGWPTFRDFRKGGEDGPAQHCFSSVRPRLRWLGINEGV